MDMDVKSIKRFLATSVLPVLNVKQAPPIATDVPITFYAKDSNGFWYEVNSEKEWEVSNSPFEKDYNLNTRIMAYIANGEQNVFGLPLDNYHGQAIVFVRDLPAEHDIDKSIYKIRIENDKVLVKFDNPPKEGDTFQIIAIYV